MTEERRKYIRIRGANEHNLKNIDLEIPRNELFNKINMFTIFFNNKISITIT